MIDFIFHNASPREWSGKEWAHAYHRINIYNEHGRLPQDKREADAVKLLAVLLENHPCPNCFQSSNVIQAGGGDVVLDPSSLTDPKLICVGCGCELVRVRPATDGGRGWFWRVRQPLDPEPKEAGKDVLSVVAAEDVLLKAAVSYRRTRLGATGFSPEETAFLKAVDDFTEALRVFGR